METKCTFCGGELSHSWVCIYRDQTVREVVADRSYEVGAVFVDVPEDVSIRAARGGYPKPATVEPPAWKAVGDGFEYRADAPGIVRRIADRRYEPVEISPGNFEITLPAVSGSPLTISIGGKVFARAFPPPDPIAEFNARRIAKRRVEHTTDQDVRAEKLARWAKEDAARALDRACLLDLHHTISDLIRPWRGK